jgi:hypothetical protein
VFEIRIGAERSRPQRLWPLLWSRRTTPGSREMVRFRPGPGPAGSGGGGCGPGVRSASPPAALGPRSSGRRVGLGRHRDSVRPLCDASGHLGRPEPCARLGPACPHGAVTAAMAAPASCGVVRGARCGSPRPLGGAGSPASSGSGERPSCAAWRREGRGLRAPCDVTVTSVTSPGLKEKLMGRDSI